MRVRCIANTGKGFSEYTLKHRGCSEETILPFIIGDEYTVYGQLIWKGMLQYLIQGSQEHLPEDKGTVLLSLEMLHLLVVG